MNFEKPLAGRVTLVTGGGGGIGAGISNALANAGATVIITYNRNVAKADAVVATLPGDGHWTVAMQIENSERIAAVAAQVAERHGRLDVLVNNAGMTRFVALDDLDGLDDDLIDQIFRVNWRGAFACARAFRPLLLQGQQPIIINMSSVAAKLGTGSNIAYCASKAALDSMTVSLAKVLAPDVRVIALAPGLVDGDYARSFDPAWRQQQIDATPLKRLAEPEDVGAAVVGVVAYMPHSTGCIVPVDGGRPIS